MKHRGCVRGFVYPVDDHPYVEGQAKRRRKPKKEPEQKPNGHKCVVCGKALTGRRRKLCGQECAAKYSKRYAHEWYKARRDT